MSTLTVWHADIVTEAATAKVSADLVEAIVLVESSANPWAVRYEARYRYLWDVRKNAPFRSLSSDEVVSAVPPPDFHSLAGSAGQEWAFQRTSLGLLQIMGALARELGFQGDYLSELCRVDLNLRLGCRHIAALLRWAGGNERKAVAAYNAGRGGSASSAGQQYADKVFAKRAALVMTPKP